MRPSETAPNLSHNIPWEKCPGGSIGRIPGTDWPLQRAPFRCYCVSWVKPCGYGPGFEGLAASDGTTVLYFFVRLDDAWCKVLRTERKNRVIVTRQRFRRKRSEAVLKGAVVPVVSVVPINRVTSVSAEMADLSSDWLSTSLAPRHSPTDV